MKKSFSIVLAVAILASMLAISFTVKAELPYTGNVYYVDPDNGSDSASGLSESDAWQTLKKVNSTYFDAGDAILLKKGSVFEGGCLWIEGGATKASPITVSSYGEGDKPMIVSSYESDGRLVDAAVYIYNQSYITIDGLYIVNGSTGTNDQFGIRVIENDGYTTKNITIKNCVINGDIGNSWRDTSKKGMTGIDVSSTNWYGYINGLLIEDNEIYNCKSNGIVVNGSQGGCDSTGKANSRAARGVEIRGNYLKNIGKDGIFLNNVLNPLVEYNTCDKAHSYATTSYHVAMWPFSSKGAVFQYNEAFNTQTTYDGYGYDSDYQSYDTLFQYNYSHDNQGGFMLICTEPQNWDGGLAWNENITVRYNISQNDQNHSIMLSGSIHNVKIYNNTLYSSEDLPSASYTFDLFSRGVSKFNGNKYADDTLIANNIFYVDSNGGFKLDKTTNTVFCNNLIYGKDVEDVPMNDDEEPYDDGITSYDNIYDQNPMLVKAGGAGEGLDTCYVYQLQDKSPAIGTGRKIENDGGKDFFGNELGELTNIGAYGGAGVSTLKGDVNLDGVVNILDVQQTMQILAKAEQDKENVQSIKNGDIDEDGVLSAIDLRNIYLIVLGNK